MRTLTDEEQSGFIADTRRWLERAVIGLNLCPFAKAVHVKGQIRYAPTGAESTEELIDELVRELETLAEANPERIDTTLLVHPFVLDDFLDYNDFLDVADELLDTLDLDGEIQIASFHPRYQFEGTTPDDITNFTNRAPYPTLHLLREASIDRAVAAFPAAEQIFEKNMETMRALGEAGWATLQVGATPKL
jgi:hypothetical protein